MMRYNEDPCLNLSGPERKFQILLEFVKIKLVCSHKCSSIGVFRRLCIEYKDLAPKI